MLVSIIRKWWLARRYECNRPFHAVAYIVMADALIQGVPGTLLPSMLIAVEFMNVSSELASRASFKTSILRGILFSMIVIPTGIESAHASDAQIPLWVLIIAMMAFGLAAYRPYVEKKIEVTVPAV